jgi:hypothetical protein
LSNSPFQQVKNLRARLAEKADEIGVRLLQFSVPDIPEGGDDEPVFMAIFALVDEQKYQGDADTQIEQHGIDQAFASLVEDLQVQEDEEKENQVKQRLLEQYRSLRRDDGDDGAEAD